LFDIIIAYFEWRGAKDHYATMTLRQYRMYHYNCLCLCIRKLHLYKSVTFMQIIKILLIIPF